MITQTVTIPAPCNWINANDRLHWRKKADLTALWREVAGWAVKQHRPATRLQYAHVDVVMWFRTSHSRDAANYHPTVKAVIDGLVKDGGMLPDDSDEYMTGPMLFTGSSADRPSPKFVGMRVIFRELTHGSSPSGETSATLPAAPGGAS